MPRGYFVSGRVILSPQIDLNFRHLSSKLWHCMYSVFMMCNELFVLQELLRSKTIFEQEMCDSSQTLEKLPMCCPKPESCEYDLSLFFQACVCDNKF